MNGLAAPPGHLGRRLGVIFRVGNDAWILSQKFYAADIQDAVVQAHNTYVDSRFLEHGLEAGFGVLQIFKELDSRGIFVCAAHARSA